jgi:hypothetical protein
MRITKSDWLIIATCGVAGVAFVLYATNSLWAGLLAGSASGMAGGVVVCILLHSLQGIMEKRNTFIRDQGLQNVRVGVFAAGIASVTALIVLERRFPDLLAGWRWVLGVLLVLGVTMYLPYVWAWLRRNKPIR